MTTSILNTAARLLRQHYGAPDVPGDPYRWTTLVHVVAGRRRSARREAGDAAAIEDGPLRTARETSETQASGLAEFLKVDGYPPRLAGTLRGLARWWLTDDGRNRESPDGWRRPVESLRNELRSLPGVSPTMADRILLLVGGLPAFPIDRATIRIAGRHGWVDLSAEYEEWQAFFTRGASDTGDSPAELHRWFEETGRDFCRTEPRCEECPLFPLLPPSGPVALSDIGSD